MGYYFCQAWRRLASSIQEVTKEVMFRVTRTLHCETGVEYLCMGGIAANCVGDGGSYERSLQGYLDSARSDSRDHLHMLRCNLSGVRDVSLFSETAESD